MEGPMTLKMLDALLRQVYEHASEAACGLVEELDDEVPGTVNGAAPAVDETSDATAVLAAGDQENLGVPTTTAPGAEHRKPFGTTAANAIPQSSTGGSKASVQSAGQKPAAVS